MILIDIDIFEGLFIVSLIHPSMLMLTEKHVFLLLPPRYIHV
jgi:hypothetical protein